MMFLYCSDQIAVRQSQVDKLYAGLKDLAGERRSKLEEVFKLYTLHREIDDLLEWIAEKSVVAGSNEPGQDYEHVCVCMFVMYVVSQRCRLNWISTIMPKKNAASEMMVIVKLRWWRKYNSFMKEERVNQNLLPQPHTKKKKIKLKKNTHLGTKWTGRVIKFTSNPARTYLTDFFVLPLFVVLSFSVSLSRAFELQPKYLAVLFLFF